MRKNSLFTAVAACLLAVPSYAALPLGCQTVSGAWYELLQGGQNGKVGNEIRATDQSTYDFYGAKITSVVPTNSPEFDWITTYSSGTLVLSNVVDVGGEDLIFEVPTVTVKTKSTSNQNGQLDFELYGETDWITISAKYSGIPTSEQQGADVLVSGSFSQAQVCLLQNLLVDVRQGSINLKSKGVVPVVIYGGLGVDVDGINPETIRLESAEALRWQKADVSGDGIADLVLKFATQDLAATLSETEDKTTMSLILTADMEDGSDLLGSDQVRILNKGKPVKPVKPAKPQKPQKPAKQGKNNK